MCPQVLLGKIRQLGLPVDKLDFLEVSENLSESPKSQYLSWGSSCGAWIVPSFAMTRGQAPIANISQRVRNKQQI